MSEQPNDNLLDENISRLLNANPQRPQMPLDTERPMLRALQAKQQELYPRKEQTMDTTASSTRQQTYALAAAVLAMAAAVLVAVWANRNSGPEQSGDQPGFQVAKSVQAEKAQREKLADGTVVIARAGAQYTIDEARQLTLDKGDLYLIVAKSEQPFVVRTKDGSVTAHGTRFAVSAGEQTTAAVAQGRVELAGDAGRIQLRAGQQATLTAGQRPTRQPAPRLSYLVNWAREHLAQDELLVEKADARSGLVAMDPWGQEVRLTLRKYDVDVYIEDGIARTTIDQTFFNHNPWNTEGTFYFPLPPDASVSRLAMYVAGRLNEGGMVERGYGQQVYNDIRYQWRDPALLEMMEGNVFKMRIFPLEGRQEKRVFLSYTQTLPELYGTLRYWFPMDHTHNVAGQLSIRVHIKDGARNFDPQSSTHQLKTFHAGDDLVLEYTAQDARPDQDFLLNLVPTGNLPGSRVAVAKKDGHRFLFARVNPQLTGTIQHRPRQWVVLNDVSASRTAIEGEAQRYIIHRLVHEADDDDSIALIDLNTRATPRTDGFLSVQQARTTGFSLTNSASTDRSVRLKSRLLGATNVEAGLQAAARLVQEHAADNPHILYLGDGVATDGQTEITPLVRKIPAGATFLGIGVGKKVEARLLQSAADATGGMYTIINPDEDIDWRVFDLLAALNTPRLTGLQVSLQSDGRGTVETIAYPSTRVLADGETLQVVARYGEDLPAQLVLRGRLGDRPWEKTYDLADAKADAEYIPRLWAKRHIDELLKSGVEFKDEIVALSKQYYVVTPHTSLIVLENDEMYKEYKVERGRKDHWALYPAPKEIEVVTEPIDWSRGDWWGGAWQGEDAKVKAKAKPKSIDEIVESVQFRINAPFYYWQPQQYGQGRYALYQLLDSDADPTRLLTYVFAVASGKQLPSTQQPAGDGTGNTQAETTTPADSQPTPVLQLGQTLGGELLLPMFGTAVDGKEMAVSGFFELPETAHKDNGWLKGGELFNVDSVNSLILPTTEVVDGRFLNAAGYRYWNDRSSLLVFGLASGKYSEAQRMLRLGHESEKLKHLAPAVFSAGLSMPGSHEIAATGIAPPVIRGYQQALNLRWARIDRDVRDFNRQFGYWEISRWDSHWNSLDLTRSASARLYGGLEGLLGDYDNYDDENAYLGFITVASDGEMLPFSALDSNTESSIMPLVTRLTERGRKRNVPAFAQLAVYGQAMKTLPGACAILAAEYLVPRRAALRNEGRQKQKELAITELALSGAEAAAARLEDSGAFWSYQGWNYRPQPWTFQPPTVQAYPNYNWSFDLTRYADGLYSTQFDVLNEVAQQYGQGKGRGKISDEARSRIDQARAAIRPVRIRYDEAGPELLAASGDRFAVRRRTDMYLHERMVCDGQNVLHEYAELGLVARRKATELRLAALRQLAPHFVQPADSIARRFDVALEGTDDEGFTLRLLPVICFKGQLDDSPSRLPLDSESRATDECQYHILVRVGSDGLIRHKTLMVNDQRGLKLVYEYKDEKVSVRWFDKDDKQLAEHSFVAEPLDSATIAKEKTFEVDLSGQVVIDMPLRRPSYYTEQLSGLGEGDIDQQVRIKRHYALSSIQELQWRRWGQTNPEAQKSLTEAIELLHKAGRRATLGDLVLLGSAGVQNVQQLLADKTDVPKSSPVYRYFNMRSAGWADASKLRDEQTDTLVGHLSGYYAAAQQQENMNSFDAFLEKYADSPLVLAAAYFRGNWGSKPEPWLRLYDVPRWRGMAVLLSADHIQNPDQRAQLAEAFKKWYDEITGAGYDMEIPQQLVGQLKQYDDGKLWREVVEGKFQRAKQQQQVAPLLGFAENALSWGEPKLAEEALQLIRQRLGDKDSLLARLALAQVYWSGGRPKEALKLYEEILAALDKLDVQPSPALLAATARLAQQSGDAGRAIELEEQALAAEHPYLPEMINLQAFRQRYTWLWQQYQSKIQSAASEKDEKAVADWLARATTAWQRWFEVDHENAQMIQQMATLLATAGRSDDAWLYLSTLIDQKPKDATSYYHVGQWYLGRNNPDEAQRYYATAYTWDTANPRWLVERAQILTNMQRRDEARQLYRQVINGKWAPALQGYVTQAKEALK